MAPRLAASVSVGAFAVIALSGCGGGGAPTPAPAPAPAPTWIACEHILQGTPQHDMATIPSAAAHDAAVKGLDMEAVKADMTALLATSNACWPADYGNYGPFMIRLAWHCSGTYRTSDGAGGCGGGRQRFEPERSWEDNTNLDKGRALLWPLKDKYGDALSWGDLFILAGTTALRDSGAPITKMCFGRRDEADGAKSTILNLPCKEQGKCGQAGSGDIHGATTVGLIYVNPEGPMGVPDPDGSVADVRQTFKAMGHSDRGTVALIGGGHAIGKTHGACAESPGLPPKKAFEDGKPIWQGTCGGTGQGASTVTSGFEGAWTTKPLVWDNEFFQYLRDKEWEKHEGPGGHWQWRIKDSADESYGKVMRLTSDIALLRDSTYSELVDEFATNMTAFNDAFDDAWERLTVDNVGGEWSPEAKCDDNSSPVQKETMRGDDVEVLV